MATVVARYDDKPPLLNYLLTTFLPVLTLTLAALYRIVYIFWAATIVVPLICGLVFGRSVSADAVWARLRIAFPAGLHASLFALLGLHLVGRSSLLRDASAVLTFVAIPSLMFALGAAVPKIFERVPVRRLVVTSSHWLLRVALDLATTVVMATFVTAIGYFIGLPNVKKTMASIFEFCAR